MNTKYTMNKPFNVQVIRSFISAYNNFKRSFLQWFAENTTLIHLPFNMILGENNSNNKRKAKCH